MSRLDTDPDVVAWGSEECIVRYWDPVTKKSRRYFPDVVVKYRDGTVRMIEVKPANQQAMPRKGKKSEKRFLAEAATWMTNNAKWEAAVALCKTRGWEFVVWNEYDLGIRAKKR